MLPPLDASGNLPAGIHEAAWDELAARYGTTQHQQKLHEGLKPALHSLRSAGSRRAYIDGSFVTAKPDPEDFDACWEESNVDPVMLDPALMDCSDRRRRARPRRGELFPADLPADPASTEFIDHFQRDKFTREPKGIVAIDLEDLP